MDWGHLGGMLALLCLGQSPAPVLTLEEALLAARAHNRQLEVARLEAQKHEGRIESVRSRHLPQLQLGLLEARLLNPVSFTFSQGVFGTFPPIGPVPPADTAVRIAPKWATILTAVAAEPLTQHYKIHLGVQAEIAGRDLALEQARESDQKTLGDVRAAYFQLSSLYFAEEAAQAQVQTLKEVLELTQRYLALESVLPSDQWEVQARLARAELQLLRAQNGRASQSERLNILLGRDSRTPFRPTSLPAPSAALELPSAPDSEASALAHRAELKEARLKQALAALHTRSAYADFIPDVSVVAAYLGLYNVDVLPTHVGTVALFLNWEPWDWGRKGNALDETKKTAQQAGLALAEAEAQIRLEVSHCHRRVSEADLEVRAAHISVEAARAKLEVARHKYREAAVVLKELLSAEAQLAGAQKDLSDALSSYWSARANLMKAVGE